VSHERTQKPKEVTNVNNFVYKKFNTSKPLKTRFILSTYLFSLQCLVEAVPHFFFPLNLAKDTQEDQRLTQADLIRHLLLTSFRGSI
jgi:hypothetical protein